ncbi:MAG: nucleoside-binding protein [Nitrospinota bacterium]|nr:nucleoside-binding protein [Nitrospinota bacterium]
MQISKSHFAKIPSKPRLVKKLFPIACSFLLFIYFPLGIAHAAEWSINELHYQQGALQAPSFTGGKKADTDILTFQHASGWAYGDTFYFIDYLQDNVKDGFNDSDVYGELYINLSMGKVLGQDVSVGPVRDLGIIFGLNAGADANVRKMLPGIRLSWDIPGFAFLNTDITAYIDRNGGVSSGGAPKESDSFMVDLNWAYPFMSFGSSFSIEGHVEYIEARTNEFNDKAESWILGQPQIRYDLGADVNGVRDKLFVGIEWQYWMNKLGDSETDENIAQVLIIWRL